MKIEQLNNTQFHLVDDNGERKFYELPHLDCNTFDELTTLLACEFEPLYTVNSLKEDLIIAIDEHTSNTILSGFTFENCLFSMSLTAQINWSNLLQLPEQIFPITISTKDDSVYVLEFANRMNFYLTCVAAKNLPLQQGTILKNELKALTTIEEVLTFKQSLQWS